jgi:spoIIIJ-associated protein
VKQVTATGQTVDEAIESALRKLETTRDRVQVDIIDEGKKGIFGVFGSKPAIVKVSIAVDKTKEGAEYLLQIAKKMGVDVTVNTIHKENEVTYELSGEKIALLIGKRGQTLNALQYLVHLVVNKNVDRHKTVIVDAEGYRERRKETLIQLAERLSQKAIREKRPVTLEPMPSYERKIIHTALQENDKVSTHSDGVEPNRKVIIKPEI